MSMLVWLKLAGLAIIEIALVAALCMPIETHAILYDMDHPAPWYRSEMAISLAGLAVVAALAAPVWLAWCVIRKHAKGLARK
jgi:hypothetical protein